MAQNQVPIAVADAVYWILNPVLHALANGSPEALNQLRAGGFDDTHLLLLFTLPLCFPALPDNLQQIFTDEKHPKRVFTIVKNAVLLLLHAGDSAFGRRGHQLITTLEEHEGHVEDADAFRNAYAGIPQLEEEEEEEERVIV